ncbi:hypothetical protein ABT369_33110 [Dactylosporangium sp. NPDC000244]|uniref:hypothetical protein n=1 Tax=Dactylosporangium sp. NPDC000244 TaxID=3154365 RepID=UPI003329A3E2
MSPEEVLQSYAGQDVAPTRMSADDVLDAAKTSIRRGRTRVAVVAGVAALLVLAGVAFALPSRRPDRGLPAVPPSGNPSVSGTARAWPPAVTKPGAPLSCTAQALPELAGTTPDGRVLRAIDPSGQWIVGSSKIGPLIWHDGKVSSPPAARNFVPAAVDAQGTIGGYENLADHRKAAALLRGGKVVRLQLPNDAVSSEVTDLDAHGNLLGTVELDGHQGTIPVLWPGAGAPVPLVTPPELKWEFPDVPRPSAMNGDGVMVGHVYLPPAADGGRTPAAYRWTFDGGGMLLDAPTGEPRLIAGDWVIGTGYAGADLALRGHALPAEYGQAGQPSVRWNMRTGTADAMGPFTAVALSETGRAVGVRDTKDYQPAVWSDGTVTPLPLPAAAAGLMYYADISADGRTVVATTRDGDHGPYAIVKWTC